jgi:hypothetical protein
MCKDCENFSKRALVCTALNKRTKEGSGEGCKFFKKNEDTVEEKKEQVRRREERRKN